MRKKSLTFATVAVFALCSAFTTGDIGGGVDAKRVPFWGETREVNTDFDGNCTSVTVRQYMFWIRVGRSTTAC